MARLVEEKNISRLDIKNIGEVTSVNVERKFGRVEDLIEIHIHNLRGDLLHTIPKYSGYKTGTNIGGLTNEINIDPLSILNEAGFSTGRYRITANILKRKIENTNNPPFRISEISATRTELKLTNLYGNTRLDSNSRSFIQAIQNATYFRDFNLNFGNNTLVTGVNIDIDKSNPNDFLLLIKTLKPLSEEIDVGNLIYIDEDIIEPVQITYDLGTLPLKTQQYL